MPPDRQPRLTGELVTLRPMTADDWTPLFAIASDPLMWRAHPAHDRWQEPVFRTYFDAGLASGGALTVLDGASGAVIGSSRYGSWQPDAREIEIGWTYYARDRWGGGYNHDAKRLMLDHISRFVDVVTFTIGEDNWPSRNSIERLGAVARPGRVMREMAGKPMPHLIYEIRK